MIEEGVPFFKLVPHKDPRYWILLLMQIDLDEGSSRAYATITKEAAREPEFLIVAVNNLLAKHSEVRND